MIMIRLRWFLGAMISEGKCGSLKEREDEGNKEVMGWNMEGEGQTVRF